MVGLWGGGVVGWAGWGASFFPPLDFMIRGLTEEISYFEGEPQESLALPRFVCVFFPLLFTKQEGPVSSCTRNRLGSFFHFSFIFFPAKKLPDMRRV